MGTSSLQASTSLSLNPPLIFRQLNIMKKKVILKIELVDDSIKRKVMRGVSRLPGVESVSVDMKGKKLTLTGDVDPESIVGKLRKLCRTEIVSVEEEKEDKKKEENKEEKKEDENEPMADLVKAYQNYYRTENYARSMEEDPKACVIC